MYAIAANHVNKSHARNTYYLMFVEEKPAEPEVPRYMWGINIYGANAFESKTIAEIISTSVPVKEGWSLSVEEVPE